MADGQQPRDVLMPLATHAGLSEADLCYFSNSPGLAAGLTQLCAAAAQAKDAQGNPLQPLVIKVPYGMQVKHKSKPGQRQVTVG